MLGWPLAISWDHIRTILVLSEDETLGMNENVSPPLLRLYLV